MEYHTIDEIFAGLEKTRGKLVNTVSAVADEHANFQSAPEKWSVAHATEHLAKIEENILRLIEKLLAKAEAENAPAPAKIEPPVNFAEMVGSVQGQKFTAPDAIKPDGTVTVAESLARLADSRAQLMALRPRFEAVDLSNVRFPHPHFGAMNLYYWIAFIGLHELHHLRQISDILANK